MVGNYMNYLKYLQQTVGSTQILSADAKYYSPQTFSPDNDQTLTTNTCIPVQRTHQYHGHHWSLDTQPVPTHSSEIVLNPKLSLMSNNCFYNCPTASE